MPRLLAETKSRANLFGTVSLVSTVAYIAVGSLAAAITSWRTGLFDASGAGDSGQSFAAMLYFFAFANVGTHLVAFVYGIVYCHKWQRSVAWYTLKALPACVVAVVVAWVVTPLLLVASILAALIVTFSIGNKAATGRVR